MKNKSFENKEDKLQFAADSYGEEREFKQNPVSSKFSFDLYDEARSLVVEKIIEVKRITVGAGGERWKILENSKPVFLVEGQKLLKKEREFLRSVSGIQFLIAQGKLGIKSLNQFKKALKAVINNG